MAIRPKAIYRLNVIPIKLPMTFFIELEQIIPKFIRNQKKKNPRIAEAILRGEKKAGSITFPDFQTLLQSYSNQNSVLLVPIQTYGSMEQNSQEINPGTYSQLILDEGCKNIKWERTCLSSWPFSTIILKILNVYWHGKKAYNIAYLPREPNNCAWKFGRRWVLVASKKLVFFTNEHQCIWRSQQFLNKERGFPSFSFVAMEKGQVKGRKMV